MRLILSIPPRRLAECVGSLIISGFLFHELPDEIVQKGGDPMGVIRDPAKNKIIAIDVINERMGLYQRTYGSIPQRRRIAGLVSRRRRDVAVASPILGGTHDRPR